LGAGAVPRADRAGGPRLGTGGGALYEGERQVGFARVLSDGNIAYLADVYLLAELRGRGLGKVLVTETIEGGPFADCRWLLHTRDAHELYRRLGFSEPDDPTLMERPARGAIRRSPEAS
jgi:GNAT superfamily N-acetyltransferase